MPELEKYTNAIKQLCKSHKVKRLYAFGSILTDKYGAESDIDLIVDFDSVEISQYADNYYDFKFSLENIFSQTYRSFRRKSNKKSLLSSKNKYTTPAYIWILK